MAEAAAAKEAERMQKAKEKLLTKELGGKGRKAEELCCKQS